MFVNYFPDTVLEQRNLGILNVSWLTPLYKVSVVVPGRRDIGGIQNPDQEPQVGDAVVLGQEEYRIVDIVELMPPRKNFIYLQATCQLVAKNQKRDSVVLFTTRSILA